MAESDDDNSLAGKLGDLFGVFIVKLVYHGLRLIVGGAIALGGVAATIVSYPDDKVPHHWWVFMIGGALTYAVVCLADDLSIKPKKESDNA